MEGVVSGVSMKREEACSKVGEGSDSHGEKKRVVDDS